MLLNEKDLLRQLVGRRSVNPAFEAPEGGPAGEGELTNFLAQIFDQLGWPWLRQPVHPGRDNIVALCEAQQPGELDPVLWEVHQDTVAVEGMTIDPFRGLETNGRISGRGACDVKGSMAAMVAGLARARAEGRQGRPIFLAMTINEEAGFTGAKKLCSLWSDDFIEEQNQVTGPLGLKELRSLRPACALVAEPTELQVVVAHKGAVRWRCRVEGRAAHSSQPEAGVNAVYKMARVVAAIEQYAAEVLAEQTMHPRCGGSTVCVTTIHGGRGTNTVPDVATIDVDRRLQPGEDGERAYHELIDYLATNVDLGAATITHDSPWMLSAGLVDRHNLTWAEQVAETARACGNETRLVGVPYGTNASVISAAGIPTVVFGPGSIAQAHTADEWIAVDQLSRAAEVFYRLASI